MRVIKFHVRREDGFPLCSPVIVHAITARCTDAEYRELEQAWTERTDYVIELGGGIHTGHIAGNIVVRGQKEPRQIDFELHEPDRSTKPDRS